MPTGRAIFNLNYASSIAHAFRNYFKAAASRQASGGAFAWPSYVDANGYPNADMPSSLLQRVAHDDVNLNYTGRWVLKWTGKLAAFRITPNVTQASSFTIHSGSSNIVLNTTGLLQLSGTSGRVEFSFTTKADYIDTYFLVGANGWDGTLADMVLCKLDDEAGLDAGNPWRQDYLDYIAYLNPLGIRHVITQPIIQNFMNKWDQRVQVSEFTYGSQRCVPAYWAGTLTGSGTYTCSLPSGSPATWTDEEIITAYLGTTNGADDPTLDVGSRGAKTIVGIDLSTVTAGSLPVGNISFLYDALNDKLITLSGVFGGVVPCGWPVELAVDLANRTNTNLYLPRNCHADDDYVEQNTILIRTTLNSGLKFTDELDNELWNPAFIGYKWFEARGQKLGSGGTALNGNALNAQRGAIGLRVRQTAEIVTDAWSPRSMSELCRAIPAQAHGNISNFETYTYLGTDLGDYGYDVSPNRPGDWTDDIVIAPYITGAQISAYDANWSTPLTEALQAADDYASGTPALMESALDWVSSDYIEGTQSAVLGSDTLKYARDTLYPAWNTFCGTYGKRFSGYEGGIEMAALSTSRCTTLGISTDYSAKFANLILAWKQSSRSKVVGTTYLEDFVSFTNSGDPAVFTNIGSDAWSMRTGLYDTPFGLEDAFRLFNRPEVIGGGWIDPKAIEENDNRKQRLKKNDELLEQTIRLAHQRLTGKITEPPVLKDNPKPERLAIHAKKMAQQLVEKSKESAKLRTRNKQIIADLRRLADEAKAERDEEELIIVSLLLH